MLAIGKHLGLVGQIGAAGIDQVDARQPVLARHFLRPQVLLHRQRVIGAALDGGVVAHDHAFTAPDAADAGDDAGGVDRIVIHAEGGQRRQFEERRSGIDETHHPLARQQLAAGLMTIARLFAAAGGRLRAVPHEIGGKARHRGAIGGEILRSRRDVRLQDGHVRPKILLAR